jgi:hypothetical protein
MPTAAGPNIKGQENLVFGYDLGDVRNSYRGEPTENLAPSGGRTGATALPRQSYHVLAWTYSLETNINGRTDVIRMYINPPGDTGQPYTDFGFQASKPGGSVVGDRYTISFDYYVKKGNSTPSFGSIYANGYKSPTSAGAATLISETTRELGNGWYRRSRTVEITIAGNTWWRGGISSNNLETEAYIDNIQLEYKGHETPFVDGTRSATQGLLDLTGNSTIDISNVSFDSSAQMTFDGTNDYAPVSFSPSVPLYTLETVFYNINTIPNNDSAIGGPTSYQTMFWFNQDAPMGVSLGGWTSSATNEAIHIWSSPSAPYYLTHTRDAVPSGYHHLVFSWNGSYYDIYLNGEKQTIYAGNNGHARLITLSNLTVGGDTASDYHFNGNIDIVKLYSRGLTASEIKSNYNAIKGRFNI